MELGTLYYRNKDGEMVPFQGITEAKFEDCSGYSEWADEKVIDSIPAGREFSFELKQDDMIAHWWMMWKLGVFEFWNKSFRTSTWLWYHQSVFAVGFMRRLYGIFGIRALGLYLRREEREIPVMPEHHLFDDWKNHRFPVFSDEVNELALMIHQFMELQKRRYFGE